MVDSLKIYFLLQEGLIIENINMKIFSNLKMGKSYTYQFLFTHLIVVI